MAAPSLQNRCPELSVDCLICTLQTCKRKKSPTCATRLHAYLREHELETHKDLGNYLVCMLVECGSLPDAQQVFNKLPYRSVQSWNSLILGYVNCGDLMYAFFLRGKMQGDSVNPNVHTFLALLKGCTLQKDVERAQQIRADIAQRGLQKDLILGNKLIDMLSKCGLLAEARETFDNLPGQDAVSWNALIAGYVGNGGDEEALSCFELMKSKSISPTAFTFASGLKACAYAGDIQKGHHIYADVVERGWEKNLFVGNTLVYMFAKCSSLAEAQKVFNLLLVKDVVSWNALITGYVEHEHAVKALKLYEDMQLEGISPDSVTFVCCLKACGSIGALEVGREVHGRVARIGLETNCFVGSVLVDMYCNCGSLVEAHELFDKLPVRNVVSWNALIAGYIDHGDGEGALSCFEKMLREGVFPTAVTLVCGIRACGIVGALEGGRKKYVQLTKMGLEKGPIVGRIMVDVFVKCGSIADAESVFEHQQGRDFISWSALVSGYIEHGLHAKALSCFEQVQMDGLTPDAVLFGSSLKACGFLRGIKRGCEIFSMVVIHGLEMELYVSSKLVDMFSKWGLLVEAQNVFYKLRARDAVTWNALIAGFAENELWAEASENYKKMLSEGVCPDVVTFVCSLKACGGLGSVQKGREVYCEISKRGMEKDSTVSSALINMFGKCGSFEESHAVFSIMPIHSVASWSALAAGYAEHGLVDKVTYCIDRMLTLGSSLDNVVLIWSLKACISVGAYESGQNLYVEIVKKGLEKDVCLSKVLLDMLCKSGSLVEARDLFDKLINRDVVLWSTLIDGFVEHANGDDALECLEQMQSEGVSPVAVSLVSSLKACMCTRMIEKARELCSLIVKLGFDGDMVAANTMLDFFRQLGLLTELNYLFYRMPIRNVATWSLVIAGYIEHGFGKQGLFCYQQLKQQGISLDAVGLACSLKACSTVGAIEESWHLASEVVKKGLENDTFVGGALVANLSKCGLLMEAQQVFDKMSIRSTVTWSAHITGYANQESYGEVMKCFEQMLVEGVPVDIPIYVFPLSACGHLGDIARGQDLHTDMVMRGLEDATEVANALIEMYGRCWAIGEAVKVFDQLSVRDVVTWTALMIGYVEQGLHEDALECFKQMELNGMSPDAATFVCSLRACGSIKVIHRGRAIWVEMVKRQLETDPFVANTLVDMFGKCGALDEAQEAFENLRVRDVVSWNALIASYSEHGYDDKVLNIFEQMELQGVVPDVVTFRNALKACCRKGALERGRNMHGYIARLGLEYELFVGTQLLSMLGKCGLIFEALNLFHRLPVQSTVSWNALIAGYIDLGLNKEALDCFEKMRFEGACPNSETILSSLKACCSIGALAKGVEIHTDLVKMGFDNDSFMVSMLVDIYGKCGHLSEAKEVFMKLRVRDVALWSSMIKGYGMNHEGSMAVQCFTDMQDQGVKPDATAFTCLLAACSHASLVLDGQEYFSTMKEIKIGRRMEQYACMVDLFARSGLVNEAERLIGTMQHPPSKKIWTALLVACKNYGELQLGLKCFQHLVDENLEAANCS